MNQSYIESVAALQEQLKELNDKIEALVASGNETKDNRPVKERVKTFEDAVRELGEQHPHVCAYRAVEGITGLGKDLYAYLKLRIVVAALNEGWQPEFTDSEERWYPWHWLYTQEEIDDMDSDECIDKGMVETPDNVKDYAGLAYAYSIYAPSHTPAHIGSRLCLKSRDLAAYCGTQFSDIYASFLL